MSAANVVSGAASDQIRQEKAIQRISVEQREVMLGYMKTHPMLATGRLQGPGAATAKQRLLSELAIKLNACASGATKSEDKWLKSWQDWRSDIKQKAGKIRRHRNGTGGGPPCKVVLNTLEEELLAFIGEVVVTGNLSVPDFLEVSHSAETSESVDDPPAVENITASNPTQESSDPDTLVIPLDSTPEFLQWLPPPDEPQSAGVSGTPSSADSASEPSTSVSSKRRRKHSSMAEMDERLVITAESQQKHYDRISKLKEEKSEAAARLAAAATRQAEAAERQAKVAEEMLLVAQKHADAVAENAAAARENAAAMQTIGTAVSSAMRCLELYLQSKMKE